MASIWKSMAAGAIGGLAGAVVMLGVQRLKRIVLPELGADLDEQATAQMTRLAARAVCGCELMDEDLGWAVPGVTCVVGMGLGAAYALLTDAVPECAAGGGSAFGAAAWLIGDEIAVPLTGLVECETLTKVSAHVSAFAGHLVFGVVTDATRKLLTDAI